MAEEGKKISFSFSKSTKKSTLKNAPVKEEKKVDYIECINENKIKVYNEVEKQPDAPLVIPMLGTNTLHDRIINKINADIYGSKPGAAIPNGKNVKNEISEIKTEPISLDEQAAQELIQDMQSTDKEEKNSSDLTIPIALQGDKESSLEDYEKIPVEGYGIAMLRGMGWQPGKGLGKNEKIVENIVPELRPRGMGLGADKALLKNQNRPKSKEEEQLELKPGGFVKIIAGRQNGNYGEVMGFDDEARRIAIKMALGGNTVWVVEPMVQLVTKTDYAKNAKVLNAKKFDEYKNDEKVEKENGSENSEEDEKEKEEKSREKSKKSKKRRNRSRDSDSDFDQPPRKRRTSSSDSHSDEKYKRSKKSEKHKKRGSSSERLSKKNRKKDKERERNRDRRFAYSESSNRKHKKHKRSRSKSPSRR